MRCPLVLQVAANLQCSLSEVPGTEAGGGGSADPRGSHDGMLQPLRQQLLTLEGPSRATGADGPPSLTGPEVFEMLALGEMWD